MKLEGKREFEAKNGGLCPRNLGTLAATEAHPAHTVVSVDGIGAYDTISRDAMSCFFCTSGGAVCAGYAQVTLVECKESYQPGCNRTGKETKPNKPPQNPHTTKNNTKTEREQPVE